MQINLKTLEKAIEVQNSDSLLTLKIDKKVVYQHVRVIGVMALFAILTFLLVLTYQGDSAFFWPLSKAAFILVLVAFVALQSNRQTKKA